MSDDADRASEIEARRLADSLARHRAEAARAGRVMPRGHCLNQACAEPFPESDRRLFCNAKCAREFEIHSR